MLNERLRFARKCCGFTQQQIADYLGIKRSTYAYYETGHTSLPIELLPALCKAFGVTADWMLHNHIRFESEASMLKGIADKDLPGLANLTAQERELLLLLRKHQLTDAVTAYAKGLTLENSTEELTEE